jgi:polar amino acid transport system substrate-binding protein
MKKEIKAISVVLIIAMVSIIVALSGCTEEKGNKIIVGTSADFPPFEYKEGDKIVGFDVEMITDILTSQNYTVEVQDMAFDSLIAALQTNKIDVIVAGMSITEERLQEISFSDPYFEADQSVLIKSDSGIVINNESDLENLTVGVQTGTTGDDWVFETLVNTSKTPEEKYKQYETYDLAVLDLKAGRIQIIVLDKPVAQALSADGDLKIAYTIVTNENYGIGVRKGDTELLQKINTGLAELKASADWNTLVTKYFP